MDYQNLSKELRRDIIKMIHLAKSGHPGGSLSIVEILIALYYNVMVVNKDNANDETRDLFVLSKGHSCPALYAMLSNVGFISKDELWTLRKIDSKLQGHPDHHKTLGVEVNTGSLGQGASVSIGLALAAKRKSQNNSNLNGKSLNGETINRNCQRVYTVIGDGEMQEGIIWEAAMSASNYKLDNLTFILDYNGLQIDGKNDEVMALGDIMRKFESFGFKTYEVDGHNIDALTKALNEKCDGKPKFIKANTIKGKGVSFMENQVGWHGKATNDEEYAIAMKELA